MLIMRRTESDFRNGGLLLLFDIIGISFLIL